jgi:hypothetical protein
MLSYKILGPDTYDSINNHAHNGKGVIKKVIEALEKKCESCSKDRQQAISLHKCLPFIDDQTARYAMEEFKKYTLQQSEMCNQLKELLTEGPLAEANVLLNNYRLEWPKLNDLAKQANSILLDLEKQEKESFKKKTKVTYAEETLRKDIEEGQEFVRVSSKKLNADEYAGGDNNSNNTSTSPITKKSHHRSRTVSGISSGWFSLKKKSMITSKSPNSNVTRKSIRKMEKSVNKMVTKAGKVAENVRIVEREYQEAKAELDKGRLLHAAQMKEILAGFQRLEIGRGQAIRGILLKTFNEQKNYYEKMLENTEFLITCIENIDPEFDTQYFIRRTRKVKNPWRSLSGNVPVVTEEYHTPVSAWTTNKDEDSGHYFYTNTETNETSWTPPEYEDVPPAYDDLNFAQDTHPLPSELENERRMQAKMQRSAAPEDDWDAVVDEATQQVYYYNSKTGASSWTWPPVIEEANITRGGEEATGQGTVTEYQEPAASESTTWSSGNVHQRSQSQPTNVSDWVLHQDPNTGNQYWFNETTQQTQWA